MNLTPEIITSYGKPSDGVQWDTLCRNKGSLQQSTLYDEVQSFFRQRPVYLEVWQGGILLGGMKVYIYTPGKFSKISAVIGKYFLQAGECVIAGESVRNIVLELINGQFEVLIKKEKPVYFTAYGYFNEPENLLAPGSFKKLTRMDFANSFIDLTQSAKLLWENIHPHHKRKIIHAEKEDYTVTQTGNIDILLDLLSKTYQGQSGEGPNPAFVAYIFKVVADRGLARIFVARKEDRPVSAALVTLFGPVAYYAYGGSERGNSGASHFLHWNIIRSLAEENIKIYYFGQVAVEGDNQDEKFVRGISPFKRRFGTKEVVNSRKTFIFKPYSYQLWKTITTFTRSR